MAFIRDVYSDISDGDTASMEVVMPNDFQPGDLLLVFISQDNGGTEFSCSDSSWTELYDNESTEDGVRQGCYYKIADGSETSITISGYDSADWSYVIFSIGDVDTNNPIDTYNLVSYSGDQPASPSLTLNYDNDLIFYSIDVDTSRFLWLDNYYARQIGGSRSLGNCIAVGIRYAETTNDYKTVHATIEDPTQGGTFAAVAIKSGTDGYKEFNINYLFDWIYKFGYTDSSTFNAPNGFASSVLGIDCASNTVDVSKTRSTISPWGYCTLLDNLNAAPSSTQWEGGVVDFGSNLDFTYNGTPAIISMTLFQNSTYYKKFGNHGIIIGFKDSNGNWVAYNIPRKNLVGYIASSIFIDLNRVSPDDSYGTIDWTSIRYFLIAGERNPETDQEAKIYLKHLKKHNPILLQGGSENLPINTQDIGKVFADYGFEGFWSDIKQASLPRIPFEIQQGSAFDFSKAFISPLNASLVNRKTDNSIEFYFHSGKLGTFNQALFYSDTKSIINFYIDNTTDNLLQIKSTSFVNYIINFPTIEQTLTLSGASFEACEINADNSNLLFDNIVLSNSKITLSSLSQINGSLENNSLDDYMIVVTGTGDMTWDLIVENSTSHKLVYFSADSGTIDVYKTSNSDDFDYDTAGATVNVHNPQITLELTGIKEGSEVRIYNQADMTELAGVESLSGTTFTYSYEYTSDIDVVIVVFNVDYDPIRLEATLTNENTTIPIQQIFDRNYSNP